MDAINRLTTLIILNFGYFLTIAYLLELNKQ